MFMKDGEELVEHPIKGGFQVNPYLTYNWSVHSSAHPAFAHTSIFVHGLCLYIHQHTQPLPTPAFVYMAFVCTYICTPGLFWYCICTPGLCLYLHLHTCFFSFSDISVHLAFVGPGLYLHLHTCFFSFSDVSVHLAFVGTGLNLHTWPLSVHVSVHLAFVSTSICTPVCGVSTPHTRTCSFQPVG